MEKGCKNHRETLYSSKGKIVYVVGKPCNINRLRGNSIVTLESGIDVGPTIINLAFFSRPYGLIKGPTFINFF